MLLSIICAFTAYTLSFCLLDTIMCPGAGSIKAKWVLILEAWGVRLRLKSPRILMVQIAHPLPPAKGGSAMVGVE